MEFAAVQHICDTVSGWSEGRSGPSVWCVFGKEGGTACFGFKSPNDLYYDDEESNKEGDSDLQVKESEEWVTGIEEASELEGANSCQSLWLLTEISVYQHYKFYRYLKLLK